MPRSAWVFRLARRSIQNRSTVTIPGRNLETRNEASRCFDITVQKLLAARMYSRIRFYHVASLYFASPNSDFIFTKGRRSKLWFYLFEVFLFYAFFLRPDKIFFYTRKTHLNIAFVKSEVQRRAFLPLIIYLPIRMVVPLSKCITVPVCQNSRT